MKKRQTVHLNLDISRTLYEQDFTSSILHALKVGLWNGIFKPATSKSLSGLFCRPRHFHKQLSCGGDPLLHQYANGMPGTSSNSMDGQQDTPPFAIIDPDGISTNTFPLSS